MDIFLNEVRRRCNEIKQRPYDQMRANEVIDTFDRILYLQKKARVEGLLALEESLEELDVNEKTEAYLRFLVYHIVEGTDPNLLYEMGMNRYFAMDLPDYDGLRLLMCLKGALMIQAGENFVIAPYLKSMLSEPVLDLLEKKEAKRKVALEAAKLAREKSGDNGGKGSGMLTPEEVASLLLDMKHDS